MPKKTADNYARRMTGGEALAEMLRAYGADTMFGMGGFQLLPFYEAVRALGLGHRVSPAGSKPLRQLRRCFCADD